MIKGGVNPILAMIGAVVCGMLAGGTTGLIHTRLKIHPLLSGILVMTALYSINLLVMGRSNIPLIETRNIFSLIPFSNPTHAIFFVFSSAVLMLIALITWLLKTDFGIAMRATGNSEAMVRSMGVNTSHMKITGLAIANGLTALSGYLLTQYQGFADINMGIGIVVSGLGAVMIGEALLRKWLQKGIIYSVLAVVTGSVLFRLIIAAALSFGLNPNYLKLITALIVLIIVAVGTSKKQSAR